MSFLKWMFGSNDAPAPTWHVKTLSPQTVHASYDHQTKIMTVTYNDGSTKQFKGSSTVWHEYPMMRSCGTSADMWLYNIFAYIEEHGNPYPTAHLK